MAVAVAVAVAVVVEVAEAVAVPVLLAVAVALAVGVAVNVAAAVGVAVIAAAGLIRIVPLLQPSVADRAPKVTVPVDPELLSTLSAQRLPYAVPPTNGCKKR